jgi:type IV pilus assembly protein PilB
MQDRPKLGEILVQAGVIDELQLASALGEHQRWGRRLGVTLIKLGMVEEGHLIRALAQQLDLPIASLGGKRIADEVIALVPAKLASEHGVIPLFVKRGEKGRDHLYLGMEDPSNIAVLDDLSFRTGLQVHPVMVTPSDLGAAIDRYYFARPEKARSASAPRADETLGMPNLRRRPDPDVELDLEEEIPKPGLPESVLEDVARAVEVSERTRLVTKALTQLLIEKGVLDLAEVQAQIGRLKSGAEVDPSKDA